MTNLKMVLLALNLLTNVSFSSSNLKYNKLNDRNFLLRKITDVTVDKNYIKNLKKELYFKIQSGLNLANRSIFDEFLAEIDADKRGDVIREYEQLEKEMDQELHREIYTRVNLYAIIKQINIDVYNKYFSTSELRGLYKFYNSKLGKKFVGLSKTMLEETEKLSAKSLYPLSLRVTEGVQEKMQKRIMELLEAYAQE